MRLVNQKYTRHILKSHREKFIFISEKKKKMNSLNIYHHFLSIIFNKNIKLKILITFKKVISSNSK